MVANPLDPTSLIIGVMRPVGVATATEISAFLYLIARDGAAVTNLTGLRLTF